MATHEAGPFAMRVAYVRIEIAEDQGDVAGGQVSEAGEQASQPVLIAL